MRSGALERRVCFGCWQSRKYLHLWLAARSAGPIG